MRRRRRTKENGEDEIKKEIEKPVSHSKSDNVPKKKAEDSKEVRMAGSFLNRKSDTNLTLKSLSNNPSKKTDKNTLILEPEPESQVNIFIFILFCTHYSYIYYAMFSTFLILFTGLCVHKNRFEI
jgi:hypothetical protein